MYDEHGKNSIFLSSDWEPSEGQPSNRTRVSQTEKKDPTPALEKLLI